MTERTSAASGQRGLGELLALVCVLAYTTVNTLVRSVALEVDHVAATLIRQLPTVALAGVAIAVARPAAARPASGGFIGARTVVLLMASGLVSFLVGNILLMRAFSRAGLGAGVVAVQGGMIVGGFALSWLALGERPSARQWRGASIVVVGLVVAVFPALGAVAAGWSGAVGFAAAFGAGCCYTVANAASRAVLRHRRAAFLTALFYSSLGGLSGLVVLAAARAQAQATGLLAGMSGQAIAIMAAVGLANAVAVGAATAAVRYTSVATVSTISTLIIVASVAAAVIFFHESPHPLLLGGAGLILAGVIAAQDFSSGRLPVMKEQVKP